MFVPHSIAVAVQIDTQGTKGAPRPATAEFLMTMRDLAVVAESVRDHIINIEAALREDGSRLLKGALASLDLLFMTNHRRDLQAEPGGPHSFTKEQLAEGYPYIYGTYVALYGPPKNVKIDTIAAARGDYLGVLVTGVSGSNSA